jgi:catechol 2,3-dioxygenase-like lactoylglutathione lyase family enzyme
MLARWDRGPRERTVVIDHISVQVSDVEASRAFYEALLAPLGLVPTYTDGDAVGFAGGERASFWLAPAAAAEHRELHVAFAAADRATVRAFHDAAVSVGAEVLHAPRVFPEYHADYFGCFVRDPDGHNIEAVCRRPDG